MKTNNSLHTKICPTTGDDSVADLRHEKPRWLIHEPRWLIHEKGGLYMKKRNSPTRRAPQRKPPEYREAVLGFLHALCSKAAPNAIKFAMERVSTFLHDLPSPLEHPTGRAVRDDCIMNLELLQVTLIPFQDLVTGVVGYPTWYEGEEGFVFRSRKELYDKVLDVFNEEMEKRRKEGKYVFKFMCRSTFYKSFATLKSKGLVGVEYIHGKAALIVNKLIYSLTNLVEQFNHDKSHQTLERNKKRDELRKNGPKLNSYQKAVQTLKVNAAKSYLSKFTKKDSLTETSDLIYQHFG